MRTERFVDTSPDQGHAVPSSCPVLKNLSAHDVPQILRLFTEVFGAPMDSALWNWKYGDARGCAIGGYRGDRLVSHYGGVWREMRQGSWLGTGIQFVDVMVAKEARGVFSRRNPFSFMTQAFIDRTVLPQSGASFGFGFPNLRHFQLGTQLGLYDRADDIHELNWPVATLLAHQGIGSGWRPMDWQDENEQPHFDQLCQRFHAALHEALAPVRRHDTWRHRFANHPLGVYQCVWLLRSTKLGGGQEVFGAMALRVDASTHRCEVMDCVLESPSDMGLVIALAAQLAQAHQCTQLVVWGSTLVMSRLGDSLKRDAVKTHVACFATTRQQFCGLDTALSRGLECWVMGGDTDFR